MTTTEGKDAYRAVTDETVRKTVLDMANTPGALEDFVTQLQVKNPKLKKADILTLYSAGSAEVRQVLEKALENFVEAASAPEYERVTPREPEEEESESLILTRENLHVFDAEYEYPGDTPEAREEIQALIENVCSFAGFLKKPYAQINFRNGSRVYTYTVRKGKYKPEVVSNPDVVDDFRE